MHITDIKPFPVWVGTRNQMLVKVETNEGIYGWGESGLSGRELGVKGIVENYREFLLPLLKNTFHIPLEGLGKGQQLKFFKENTKIEHRFF